MRCECCNSVLEDIDATAKFAESGAYVNMCKKCRGFLPKDLKVVLRHDLQRKNNEEEDSDTIDHDLYGKEEFDGYDLEE